MKVERQLRGRLTQAGQEFLVEHLEQLEPARQETLLAQLETIDFEMVEALRAGEGLAPPSRGSLAPLPYVAAKERHGK
ncbi:MAG: hypothetical protein OER88_14155, partial [Planctomycetota bacterium]|nr:hypothetical protein [Planctomycetota bacterium]